MLTAGDYMPLLQLCLPQPLLGLVIDTFPFLHNNATKSTHILIRSLSFLGVTTIGAHHSVTSFTGVMIPCSWSNSSSTFRFLWYADGTARGVFTQNGTASSITDMWNFSPSSIVLT